MKNIKRFTEDEKNALFYEYGIDSGAINVDSFDGECFENTTIQVQLEVNIRGFDKANNGYWVEIGTCDPKLYSGVDIIDVLEQIKRGV